MYVVSLVARLMEAPTVMRQRAVKRALRDLKGTIDMGLLYTREAGEVLTAYCDSDYAKDVEDQKSTSDYVLKMSNGLVAWSSKKQPILPLSTNEAEFISAAACAVQSIWMLRVLEKLGVKQNKYIICCDNSSTIMLSKNLVLHGKSKHIHVGFHFLRKLANKGEVDLIYCGIKDQLVYVMTKALKLEIYTKLRERLRMYNFDGVNRSV